MKLVVFLLFIFSTICINQGEIYRDLSKLEISPNYEMKKEPYPKSIEYSSSSTNHDPVPKLHLSLDVSLVSVIQNDYSVQLRNQKGEVKFSKKSKKGTKIKIDFGEIELAKERKTNYLYTLAFLNKEKTLIDRVDFEIKSSGALFVNGKPLNHNK